MHVLILNTHLLHARFLQKALRYKNIGADLCQPENLSRIWYGQYEGIVLPLRTPEGPWLKNQLRNIAALGKIPVLLLSEPVLSAEKIQALQKIPLPLKNLAFSNTFDRLCETLLELTEKDATPQPGPSRLEHRDLTIDLLRHEVHRGDRSIALRNKEFALLVCLAQNEGKVLTRTYLLEKVWDRNTSILSNTVDVHINRLRHKIDHPQEAPLIHTVPCAGYKLGEAPSQSKLYA